MNSHVTVVLISWFRKSKFHIAHSPPAGINWKRASPLCLPVLLRVLSTSLHTDDTCVISDRPRNKRWKELDCFHHFPYVTPGCVFYALKRRYSFFLVLSSLYFNALCSPTNIREISEMADYQSATDRIFVISRLTGWVNLQIFAVLDLQIPLMGVYLEEIT